MNEQLYVYIFSLYKLFIFIIIIIISYLLRIIYIIINYKLFLNQNFYI